MLKVENLCVNFGDFKALRDVSLEIPDGEFFTLLGPSGCGKTTTLRAITGFITPASGKITIDGKDITNVPVEKRNIGMVFQSYALFPTMTVYQNIAFSLKIQKKNKFEIDDIVREVAKKVDLTDEQLVKNVTELSGGQQQRVAIARALASNPPILCLDEPLSNLDAKLRVQLRTELKELQKKLGITMVYVTHDQEEALTLSDHICVFRKGVVDQIGTPNEIYNKSKTEYTYNFIGDINKLTPSLVETINASDIEPKLDPEKNNYIRLERVHLNTSVKKGFVTEAKVVDREYYGMYIKYKLAIGEDTIRAIAKNDGEEVYELGDKVKVGLRLTDILSFVPEPEEEPAPVAKKQTLGDKIKSIFTKKDKKDTTAPVTDAPQEMPEAAATEAKGDE